MLGAVHAGDGPRHPKGGPEPRRQSRRVPRALFQTTVRRWNEVVKVFLRGQRKSATEREYSGKDLTSRPPMESDASPYAIRLVTFTGNWRARICGLPCAPAVFSEWNNSFPVVHAHTGTVRESHPAR